MLMLIHCDYWVFPNTNFISIHLMLMLIILSCFVVRFHINFNTSHVNVNHMGKESLSLASDYFNTSHVNVNPFCSVLFISINSISIHLMLMLIDDFMRNIR